MKSAVSFSILFFCTVFGSAQNIGFSGMERLSDSTFLVVIDKKVYEDGNRLAILTIDKSLGYSIDELEVKDWAHKDGRASDLEAVCSIPGTDDEFFLVEAGYWDGKYGRIFHVRLEGKDIEVLSVFNLPTISPSHSGNPEGDNFEGVICLRNKDHLAIILGERGGTKQYPEGWLRIGILNSGSNKIDWKSYADKAVKVKAPSSVEDQGGIRSISDLHVQQDGTVYASAASDVGDLGPFKSLVYVVGNVGFDSNGVKIQLSESKKPSWVINGFKVEAVSSSPPFIKQSEISIGTEDEVYSGVWRPLR